MSVSLIAPAPFWAHYLLENPWPIAAAACALAGLLMWLARQIGRRALAWSALGIVILGCLVTPLLASIVQTPREELAVHTRQVVQAAGPVNPALLRSIFDPQVLLLGPDGDSWLTLPEMLRILETLDRRHTLGQHKLHILAAEARDPGVGHCQIDVVSRFTRGPAEGRPLRTRWKLSWRRDPPASDGRQAPWRLTRVQWLKHPAPDAIQPQIGVWDASF